MYGPTVPGSGGKEDKVRLAVLGSSLIGNRMQYSLDRYFGEDSPEVECFHTLEELLAKAKNRVFDAVAVSYTPFINDGFERHVHEIIEACNQKNLFVLFPWENKEIQKLEGQGVCEALNPLDGGYEDICRYIEQKVRSRA